MSLKVKMPILALVCILLLSACGTSKESNPASSPAPDSSAANSQQPPSEKTQEPLVLSFMGQLEVEPPQKNSEVQKLLEEATGVKLEFEWLAAAAAKEKINVTIASGQMPKAMGVMVNPAIQNAIRNQTFWEIGPYIQEFPNLAKINPIIYQNISVDGKTYGLPRVRPLVRDGLIYRKDWLNKLGLAEPTDLDSLYEVLKAFTYNDPDGNNKNDTLGVNDYKSMNLFDMILEASGAPNGWKVEEGKFTPDFMTDEYVDALNFYKKLYDEKLINQDFAVTEKTQWVSAFETGKAGMQLDVSLNASSRQDGLRKTFPEAETYFIGMLKGAHGDVKFAGPGHNGMILFPKSSVKTEAELKQILGFFNTLADDPAATLLAWGIEGKHYKAVDGVNERIDSKLYETEVKPYREMKVHGDEKENQGKLNPLKIKANESNSQREALAIANPTLPLFSATYTEKGAQLDNIINDAKVKFIMGQIDENGFTGEIDKWLKAGGEKVIQEYGEDFAKSNG